MAEWFYGDPRLHRVIIEVNYLSNPDHLVVGQELEIPYVTFRHQVKPGDTTRKIAQLFYGDTHLAGIVEVANHAGQRDLVVGEWLLIPDLANVGHHTVVAGETWEVLAERWYGEFGLWPVIALANHMGDADPQPGHVLIQPRLNRRRTVVAGDTLWDLANDHYGDVGVDRTLTLVKMVAAANLIDDPDDIAVGQLLFFPSFDLGG
ncbi:LysM peptidoglycan-binding domain-containing protein [Mycobacterium sp.]|uniref:LysM peptidoglycan-binding domain-containing protein n=1 Tax=Mycobacterium sp. TaxID=1785 RepID=UPI0039C9E8A5